MTYLKVEEAPGTGRDERERQTRTPTIAAWLAA